jgi:RNA polymerase sigma factor (sigma-70 family)
MAQNFPGRQYIAKRLSERKPMARATLSDVVDYLRKVCAVDAARELTDGQLLERFVADRDEAAFSVLVRRHGPTVLGVCRRVLSDSHLAEDSFQATFLVLVRRAAALGKHKPLGGWLYSVAQRVATRARAREAARLTRERRIKPMPQKETLDEASWQELRIILDEEIARLPEKCRDAIVLCHFENKSHEQAAKELGWPKRTLTNRLVRGRELLRQRLIKRGITLSAGVVATMFGEKVFGAPVGAMLTINTVKGAASVAAGKAVAGGCVSAVALALAEDTLSGILAIKGKAVLMVLALGLALTGAGIAGYGGFGERDQPADTERAQNPVPKVEAYKAGSQNVPMAVDLFGDPLPAGAVARLGTVRFRDVAEPTAQLVYAAGGKVLISAGFQFFGICAWNAESGQPLYRLTSPRIPTSVAVSPDGNSLFAQGDFGDFWSIDVVTGKELRQFKPGRFGQATFSPDGRTVAVAADEPFEVIRWDFATGKLLPRLAADGEIGGAAAFSPDGKILATASRDHSICLWDCSSGKELGRLSGHDKAIHSLAFSQGGKVFASAGDGREIRLWDIDKGKQLRALQGEQGFNSRLAFSPDGKILASLGYKNDFASGLLDSGVLCLWNPETGEKLHRWEGVTAMAFSPDGKTLATVQRDGVIRRWEPDTGKEIDPPDGHFGRINSLKFAPDGKTLVSNGILDGKAIAWDVPAGRVREILFESRTSVQASERWSAEAVSPNGKIVALVRWRFREHKDIDPIRLWDVVAGKELRTLKSDTRVIPECIFSPDGKLLAARAKDGIGLWDVATGKEVQQLPAKAGSFTFSPDGKVLASGGEVDQSITLWNVAEATAIRRWDTGHKQSFRLYFSPDGKWLASTDHFDVRIWETDSGKEMRRIPQSVLPLESLAFSPSGRVLAAGWRRQWSNGDELHESGAISLWDVLSGEQIRQFDVPQGSVSAVAFAPDGRTLASGGQDSTILLWDLTGQATTGESMTGPLTAKDLEALWSDLAGDAAKADRAIWALALAPKQSMPLLQSRMPTIAPAAMDKIAKLVADLDDKTFAVRQKAAKELEDYGDTAEKTLRKALEGNPPLEVRQRVEQILAKSDQETIRKLRAIETLEQIATSEARDLLLTLANASPNTRVADAAGSALQRLAARNKPP